MKTLLALLALAGLAAAEIIKWVLNFACLTDPGVIGLSRVPLLKQKTIRERLMETGSWAEYARQRAHHHRRLLRRFDVQVRRSPLQVIR